MLSGTNRDLTVEEVLDALMHAMKGVLQRNEWGSEFANNGLGPRFEIRPHLFELLEWRLPPAITSDLPSLPQFQSCFPARRYIAVRQVGALLKKRRGGLVTYWGKF